MLRLTSPYAYRLRSADVEAWQIGSDVPEPEWAKGCSGGKPGEWIVRRLPSGEIVENFLPDQLFRGRYEPATESETR